MNITEIFNKFYEKDRFDDGIRLAVARDGIMANLKQTGITYEEILAIEERISELLVIQQEEAFKDGFAVGVAHITQAVRFANDRLSGR